MSNFSPAPITLGGSDYWGLRFCSGRSSGAAVRARIVRLVNSGEAYFLSLSNPSSLRGIERSSVRSVYHAGKSWYIFKYKRSGQRSIRPGNMPVLVRKSNFRTPYNSSTGKGSYFRLVPNQGFGYSSAACGYSNYFKVIQADIRRVGAEYQTVIAAFDKAIRAGVSGASSKKQSFISRYSNYASVSAFNRRGYLTEFARVKRNLFLTSHRPGLRRRPPFTPPIVRVPNIRVTPRPRPNRCTATVATHRLQTRKQLIKRQVELLTILSSSPFYPSSVVNRRRYRSIVKMIKQLNGVLACDKKIQGLSERSLKRLVSSQLRLISRAWRKIISPARRGRTYSQVERDLKAKAAAIRSAIRTMTIKYKIVTHNRIRIPYPQELRNLQRYLNRPLELTRRGRKPRYQVLTNMPLSRLKSAVSLYIKRFELKTRSRLLYALIRVANRKKSGPSTGATKIKLGRAIRFYQRLVKNSQTLISYKGNLSSFIRWAKVQAKKIKALP